MMCRQALQILLDIAIKNLNQLEPISNDEIVKKHYKEVECAVRWAKYIIGHPEDQNNNKD